MDTSRSDLSRYMVHADCSCDIVFSFARVLKKRKPKSWLLLCA